MTTTTGRPRLPQPTEQRSRGRDVVTGLLALLLGLALVIGVPALLVMFVGWPLPSRLPDRSWLTSPIDAQTLVDVIACVVWVAWAHFTVCVAVEAVAEVRGRGMPGQVPMGGASQSAARRIVAGVLLLVTSVTVVAPAAGAAIPDRGRATVSLTQQGPAPAPMGIAARSSSTGATAVKAAVSAPAEAATKLYDVKPPAGRHYECLWDIAEKYLGSGTRYKEIVQLNHGRVQPDGRTLKDPDLIYPGWVLVMPTDATGAGLRVVDRPPAPGTTAPIAVSASASVSQADQLRQHTVTTTDAGASTGAVADADQGSASTSFAPFGMAGAMIAAGLLVALRRRRGAFGEPPADVEPEVALRLAADVPLAERVDRALRALSRSLTSAGQDLPPVYAAFLQPDALTLALSPAVPGEAPEPWVADPSGRSWMLPVSADLPSSDELAEVSAPYPGLVTLGLQDGRGSVLVDLEAAAGLVSLGGDLGVAREVAASVAVELATNLWSDDVQVTLVGFGDDLTAVAPGRVRRDDDLDRVLDVVERDTARQSAACAGAGLSSVLRGRQVRADRRLWRPEYLVLSGPPTAEQAARLAALAGDQRRGVGVVVVGDVPTARWRFAVSGDGVLHATALGLDLTAQRLSVAQYAPVVRMLAAAGDGSQGASSLVAPPDDDATGAASALADRGMADATRGYPVEVRLLGPLEIKAPGQVDEARRDLATEVVVAAALHPRGLHPNVLASAVWPRGASEAVQAAAITHVQQWLGQDAAGRPRLAQGDDGLWRLSHDVRVDWLVVQALVSGARGTAEEGDLASGLAFVRGRAFQDLPAGRYAWLARSRVERASRVAVVLAAHRLAGLAADRDDRELARESLRIGLSMVPTAELLWRDLMRLDHEDGGPQASATIAQETYAVLAAHHVPKADAETDALVDELSPGVRLVVA